MKWYVILGYSKNNAVAVKDFLDKMFQQCTQKDIDAWI